MKPLQRFLSPVLIVCLPLLVALTTLPLYATQTDAPYSKQIHSFDDLPQGLAYAITQSFQHTLPSTYSVKSAQSDFCAKNHANDLKVTFTDTGPTISNTNTAWLWGMTLTRWGKGKSLIKAPSATLTATGPRMEYKRGGSLLEWYMNTPWGLEQGFTVHNKPFLSNHCPSPLILELTVSGSLQPVLQGTTLLLSDKTGTTPLRYTGLYAFDAKGRTLPSHLALTGDSLRIMVDDTAATYPITIDPWVQRAKLMANDGQAKDYFGWSVAISGDTVVVGAYGDDSNKGSVYVFEKLGNSWTQQAKLTAGDGTEYEYFGGSVAISGDTVVVGAYFDDDNGIDSGSAYIFKLTPTLAPVYMLLTEDNGG